MNRRTCLTWIGLGWLARASPTTIGAVIAQSQGSRSSKSIVFYVAPNGNDAWSGKPETPNAAKTDGPFATIERSRDAIRELKRQQGGTIKQPITVVLRGGTYFLPEPLIFNPEDSGTANFPITYKAYPNELPIISGGRRITNWKKRGNLWVANLLNVKAGNWYFRLLRVDDNWAIRARYPNFDFKQPLKGGWLFAKNNNALTVDSLKFGRDYIAIDPEKFPNWKNWEGAEIHSFIKFGYGNAIFEVNKVDKKNHALFGNFTNAKYPVGAGSRFFITNIREALDSPNEWYLNAKTGELFYSPTAFDFPNNADVVAPAMNKLIVLQGNKQQKNFVKHIHFRALTFTDTNYTLADNYFFPADAAIWLSTAQQCIIADCTFVRLGGYAIRIEERSQENQIIKNTMMQLGQGGVVLLAHNTATQPFNNLIAANDIHDCGQVYKHIAGVYVTSGSENRIAHNRISRMPRYGISLKSLSGDNYSHKNIIEFNEIVDTNLETSDTGAIETLGRDRQPSGNIIRFNLIRNVVGMGTTDRGKIISPYYNWGIYLDDYSSGTTIYGNIIVNTVFGAVSINGGKDNRIENNIFVNGAESQIQLQPRDNFTTGNVIRRNIFIYKNPNAIIWRSHAKNWEQEVLKESNFNLYWHTSGLNLRRTHEFLTPKGNFTKWQTFGFDRNSLIADPLFVAPDKGNFKLKRSSPALKLGFQQIPIERISIKGFNRVENTSDYTD